MLVRINPQAATRAGKVAKATAKAVTTGKDSGIHTAPPPPAWAARGPLASHSRLLPGSSPVHSRRGHHRRVCIADQQVHECRWSGKATAYCTVGSSWKQAHSCHRGALWQLAREGSHSSFGATYFSCTVGGDGRGFESYVGATIADHADDDEPRAVFHEGYTR